MVFAEERDFLVDFMSHHPAYTAGGLCFLGGAVGFLRAKSLPSLVAGSSFGLLYCLSAYLIQKNGNYGFELATATSTILALSMARKAASLKPVPLLLVGIGVSNGIYYGSKVME